MSRFSRLQASFVLFLALETACQQKRVAVPVPSPPPSVQPPASPAPAIVTAPASTPAPSTGTATPSQESGPYQVNKPPQTAAKKAARPTTAPATATSPTPAGPAAPTLAAPPAPAPAPKLGDVLTADEQRQYSAAIDQSLSRAQASLHSIGGRQLNKDQQAEMEEIRNFVQQAQSTRSSDPAGAKSLAERAEVLARDLAASFH
jgi:hypothetical protein